MKSLLTLVALAALASPALAQDSECPGCPACSNTEPVATQEVAPAEGTPPACPVHGESGDCSVATPASDEGRAGPLADAQVEEVVAFVQELARTSVDGTISVSPEIIEEGTGISITMLAMPQVARAIEKSFGLAPGATSRCADYGACSLYGDLSSASGETLAMYAGEKAQDGDFLGDRDWLPAFKATSLAGDPVSSTDLLGRPTLLVPLAAHCTHSFQTLPLLQDLASRYEQDDLRIVGIWVNVPSAEDVRATLEGLPDGYDVEFWVSPGDGLGASLGSRLVPSHFLIAGNGKLERKFVGYKDGAFLGQALADWLTETADAEAMNAQAGTR